MQIVWSCLQTVRITVSQKKIVDNTYQLRGNQQTFKTRYLSHKAKFPFRRKKKRNKTSVKKMKHITALLLIAALLIAGVIAVKAATSEAEDNVNMLADYLADVVVDEMSDSERTRKLRFECVFLGQYLPYYANAGQCDTACRENFKTNKDWVPGAKDIPFRIMFTPATGIIGRNVNPVQCNCCTLIVVFFLLCF